MKRFIFWGAVFVFVGGVFGAGGYDWSGNPGDGSQDNPFQISTASELIEIGNRVDFLDKHFLLTADIDMDPNVTGIAAFSQPLIPNPALSNPPMFFVGSFDGDGHVISNLTMKNSDGSFSLGLFSFIGENGVVKNLGLENVSITGGSYCGGLAYYLYQGEISHCYVTGQITDCGNAGGVVYINNGGIIRNCYTNCSIDAGSYAGGIVGYNYFGGEVKKCYAKGTVSGDRSGGIAGGDNGGVYSYCFWNIDNNPGISDCGYDNAAGAYGFDLATVEGLSVEEMQTVDRFKTVWRLADLQTGCPGAWYMTEDSYPKLSVFGIEGTSVVPEVEGMDKDQCLAALEDAGFTVGEVYYVNSLSVDPCTAAGLSVTEGGMVYTEIPIDIYMSLGLSGDGSQGNPWPVACTADLDHISKGMNPYEAYKDFYYLTNDIFIPADIVYHACVIDWVFPLNFKFEGVFNGNGHKISNLVIEGNTYLGLFRYIGRGGIVRNVDIDNCRILGGTTSSRNFGIICAVNYGTISDCRTSGEVTGAYSVGGICGINSGFIKNASTNVLVDCRISGDVSMAGGICGDNNGSISNACSMGYVKSEQFAGGICGNNSGLGIITNCYCKTVISSENDYAGGLCGMLKSGSVSNCYSASKIVSGGNGMLGLTDQFTRFSFFNCFWDAEKDGLADTSPGDTDNGAVGKSTAEMRAISTFNDAGWDFVGESVNGELDIWRLCVDGSGYPRLAWEYARVGDFVCGDGVDLDDFAYFSARDYCDGCGRIFGSNGGTVDVLLLAKIAGWWLGPGYGMNRGDITGDGNVDLNDFNKAASQWLCTAPVNWDRCDLDGDGAVGDSDFDIWIGYWLGE